VFLLLMGENSVYPSYDADEFRNNPTVCWAEDSSVKRTIRITNMVLETFIIFNLCLSN
jgi:hypothetical protein